MSIRAGELFAASQEMVCKGTFECHWCASPCTNRWGHDDEVIPFQRCSTFAKRPGNQFICQGCWLFRRPSISVRSLGDTLTDRQCLMNHSWILTKENIRVLSHKDNSKEILYQRLLKPPLLFALSLKHPLTDCKSYLHCVHINDLSIINSDTPLVFTVDNKPHTYTVYELEEGLRHGTEGKMPGVRLLVELLGEFKLPDEIKFEKKEGMPGRPKKEPEPIPPSSRKIRASGVA